MATDRCPVCDNTGWEPIEADGVRRVRRCGCWLAAHPSQVANLPQFFTKALLENFQQRPGTDLAITAGRRWLKGSHDLFLAGSVGNGKTRLACSLVNECRTTGTSAWFIDVADLLERARKSEFDQDVVDPIPAVRAADLLILDDVGSLEKTSDFTLRTLLALYNARLAAQRRTIWTSNKTIDQLAELWGDERITSRIAGAAEIIWVKAADFRIGTEKAWAH